jgi:hypothetical protein
MDGWSHRYLFFTGSAFAARDAVVLVPWWHSFVSEFGHVLLESPRIAALGRVFFVRTMPIRGEFHGR